MNVTVYREGAKQLFAIFELILGLSFPLLEVDPGKLIALTFVLSCEYDYTICGCCPDKLDGHFQSKQGVCDTCVTVFRAWQLISILLPRCLMGCFPITRRKMALEDVVIEFGQRNRDVS